MLPFDPADPPDVPPPSVVQVTLWRLAVSMVRDHAASAGAARTRCAACGDRWPCRRRRLAEHALTTLAGPPPSRRTRNQAYLDWLRERALRDNTDETGIGRPTGWDG